MKLLNESQLLDPGFRRQIIQQIEGNENLSRKNMWKKWYEVYKDNTSAYVLDLIRKEMGGEDVKEVMNRVANISFCKKVINKKAMVFKEGVSFETDESNADALDLVIDKLNIVSTLKKTNKWVELFKNTAINVMPYKVDDNKDMWWLNLNLMQPYLYDVLEDANVPEIPKAFILSYFTEATQTKYAAPNEAGIHSGSDTMSSVNFRRGDGIDQAIADSPNDAGENYKEYVWWSKNYHFTTDPNGDIIAIKSPDKLQNPIGMLPIVNYTKDQDGQFWAVGGDDLVDGSIFINLILSDIFYIMKYQGMGIFYFFGKGVPKNMKVGPSTMITHDVKDKEEPDPKIGFASPSPNLSVYMQLVEMYIALLLTTNNLEPGTIQGKLSATNSASGIQDMIRKSENTEDIEDQRQMYRDNTQKLFMVIFAWINYYADKNKLDDTIDIKKVKFLELVVMKFLSAQPFMTETEKLDVIQKRKELGLDSMVDSLIRDNPDLTQDAAEKKLLKILEDKIKEQRLKLGLNGDKQSNIQDESGLVEDPERGSERL